jgi:hypothetical protein
MALAAALSAGGNASDETVTPLINDLTAALDTATASLATLSPVEARKRQSDDDIANLVAGILTVCSFTCSSNS